MKVSIRGDEWRFEIVSDAYFRRIHKEFKDSEAVTDTAKHMVHFKYDAFCLETITHELVHVFCSYLSLASTHEVTLDDHEEMIADVMASSWDSISKLRKEIFKGLRNVRRKKV